MKLEDVRPDNWLSLENFENEKWVSIKGIDNYLVSNYGRIKSLTRSRKRGERGMIMRERYDRTNHCSVCLFINGEYVTTQVHRLVAVAFIPNPNEYLIINHKDENPLNNHVDNLEWCTYKYNSNYGRARENISNSLKGHDAWNAIPVCQYDLSGNFIKKFESIVDAGRKLGIKGISMIYEICEGRANCTSHGYQWKYAKDSVDYTKNIGPTKIKYSTNKRPVYQYDMNMNFIASYASACDAARALKIAPSGINECCHGKLPHSHHYLWFYTKQH
jgi:hypothetical protein